GERGTGLHMPRLAFNRHTAVRARAQEHDGLHRKRRVEVKLAPHPYPHRPRFIQFRRNACRVPWSSHAGDALDRWATGYERASDAGSTPSRRVIVTLASRLALAAP